jgi:hypothetical protein
MAKSADEFEELVAHWLQTSSAQPAFDRPAHVVVRAAMAGPRSDPRRAHWALAASLVIVTIVAATIALQRLPGAGGIRPVVGTVAGIEYLAALPLELRLSGPPQPYGLVTSSNEPSLNGRTAYRVGTIDPHAMLIAETDGTAYWLLWGPRMDEAYPEVCKYLPTEQERVSDRC